MEQVKAKLLYDKAWTYHDAASHADASNFRQRMEWYAREQVEKAARREQDILMVELRG